MRKRGSLYRRAAAIMLVLAMLFGMTGCRLFRKSKAEQAVEYMNAKYDDEFTFKSYASGDSRSYVFLSSKKFPDANIQANCSRKKDGTCYDFIDNYVYCKYEDQTREFLQKFFEEVFECEVKVDCNLNGSGTGLNKNFTNETTFDELVHDSQYSISGLIMVSDKFNITDKDEIINRVKSHINKENIVITCSIIFPRNRSEFNLQIDDYNKTFKLPRLRISMSNYNEYINIDWFNAN